VYNRACIAGLQGAAYDAVYSLSKLLEIGPPEQVTYCEARASKLSLGLLRRALTDKDFSSVRGSAAFKAFKRCIKPND